MTILQQMGIDRMTVRERIALAQDILDSVAADQPCPPLSEAKRQELARRIADADANPEDGVPWEQVIERLAGLHPGAIQMSADFDTPLPDEFWIGRS